MSKPRDIVPRINTNNLGLNHKKPVYEDQQRILGDSFSEFERSTRPGNRYLIVGFICMVLIAGAIGGGLGGGLAAQQRHCTTTTAGDNARATTTVTITAAIPTSTSSTPPPSPPCDSSKLYTPINPVTSNTSYTINSTTLTYTLLCSQNLLPSSNPILTDIQQIYSYNVSSIYACIDACALYNYQIPNVAYLSGKGLDVTFGSDRLCSAVSYGSGPSDTLRSCLLKTKSKSGPAIKGNEDTKFESAVLNWPDARLQTKDLSP